MWMLLTKCKQVSNRGIAKKQWSWMKACHKAHAIQKLQTNKEMNHVYLGTCCMSAACPTTTHAKNKFTLKPIMKLMDSNGESKNKVWNRVLLIHVNGNSRIKMFCHQPPHSRVWFAKLIVWCGFSFPCTTRDENLQEKTNHMFLTSIRNN